MSRSPATGSSLGRPASMPSAPSSSRSRPAVPSGSTGCSGRQRGAARPRSPRRRLSERGGARGDLRGDGLQAFDAGCLPTAAGRPPLGSDRARPGAGERGAVRMREGRRPLTSPDDLPAAAPQRGCAPSEDVDADGRDEAALFQSGSSSLRAPSLAHRAVEQLDEGSAMSPTSRSTGARRTVDHRRAWGRAARAPERIPILDLLLDVFMNNRERMRRRAAEIPGCLELHERIVAGLRLRGLIDA